MSTNAQTEQNITLVVRAPKDAVLGYQNANNHRSRMAALARYFEKLSLGTANGLNQVDVHIGSTAAAAKSAFGTVIAAAVAANDTITLNGTAITGKKQRASSTLTVASVANADTCVVNGITFTCATTPANAHQFHPTAGATPATDTGAATELAALINAATDPAIITIATMVANDTIKVNGITFTAKAAPASTVQFALGDGTDAVVAANIVTCVNAYFGTASFVASSALGVVTFTPVGTNKFSLAGTASTAVVTGLVGIIAATSAAAVVTIRASRPGNEGQNAYTLLGTATRLAASGSGVLAGGITVANNEFEINGASDAEVGTDVARAISASTTALISGTLVGDNYAGTITLATSILGNWVEVGGVRFSAVVLAGGTLANNEFDCSGTDTQDATSLAAQINAHPALKGRVIADSAVGVVTVRRTPGSSETVSLVKSGSPISISGAALAATATVVVGAIVKGVAGNGYTLASSDGTRLAVSGARLTGGVGGDVAPSTVFVG